jgi:uncharacterized membrane protein
LLQVGVLIAAAVVLAGGALLLAHHGHTVPALATFHGEPAGLRSLTAIARGALSGDSRALTQLGIVLLIATPVARVALTLGAFALRRDGIYVVVTGLVLGLLLYSLLATG